MSACRHRCLHLSGASPSPTWQPNASQIGLSYRHEALFDVARSCGQTFISISEQSAGPILAGLAQHICFPALLHAELGSGEGGSGYIRGILESPGNISQIYNELCLLCCAGTPVAYPSTQWERPLWRAWSL
jgi:hypothetical protein